MQKKLIALAVAALASGAAFAQSNVTIYGSVDMGVSYRSDNMYSGVGSQTAIDSGISAGNRLGFKGTEDLGNGLKGLFQLEAGYNVDTGEHAQGGKLFGRQAFVGLTGNFGTVVAGRLYAPYYSFISTLDPFKAGTVGRYNNVYGGNDLSVLLDPVRLDNAVAYVSPDFSGFNVTAAYSSNAIGADEVGGSSSNNRAYAILPRYTNGPIDIGLSYHLISAGTDNSINGGLVQVDDLSNWIIGGSYDFGMAKVAAFYSDSKVDFVQRGIEDTKVKNYMLGVTVPFGKHSVMFSYNDSEAKQGRYKGNADQWAIGWNYGLSKRTNVYAAYASIDNDQTGRRTFIRTASVGDASNASTSGYQEGFQFGVKHTF